MSFFLMPFSAVSGEWLCLFRLIAEFKIVHFVKSCFLSLTDVDKSGTSID
jgi:hypothetical protein